MAECIDRRVLLNVLATENHCNNNCSGLNFTNRPKIAECIFFNEEMGWDDRKQTHGYIRLSACKRAEISPSESTASDIWLRVIAQAVAEGRPMQRSEVALLLKEIRRLRDNEANILAVSNRAALDGQDLRQALKEMQEKLNNMVFGIGTMLDGD